MKDGLKEQLIQAALAKGVCAEGYKHMVDSPDKDAMVNYYVANPDWCLERSFPDIEVLRDHFRDVTKMGVYVDHTFHGEVLNDLQTYIFHNCKGTIKVGLNVDKAIIPMLYLANCCELEIIGVGDIIPRLKPKVPIYVFGENEYTTKDNEFVKFITYKHGLI